MLSFFSSVSNAIAKDRFMLKKNTFSLYYNVSDFFFHVKLENINTNITPNTKKKIIMGAFIFKLSAAFLESEPCSEQRRTVGDAPQHFVYNPHSPVHTVHLLSARLAQ